MKITQSKAGNTLTFDFQENHLAYEYEDKTGSGGTDVRYVDFPQRTGKLIERNEWLQNVGYLWLALGAVLSVISAMGEGDLKLSIWLFIGLGCVAWARWQTVVYTTLNTDQGKLFIIQDKQHDTILGEIQNRKHTQLLRWYGEINPDNDLDVEINKYNWLVEQGALSREQADEKIAQAKNLIALPAASVIDGSSKLD